MTRRRRASPFAMPTACPVCGAAALREEDYQLAYAIDILKGLSALDSSEN